MSNRLGADATVPATIDATLPDGSEEEVRRPMVRGARPRRLVWVDERWRAWTNYVTPLSEPGECLTHRAAYIDLRYVVRYTVVPQQTWAGRASHEVTLFLADGTSLRLRSSSVYWATLIAILDDPARERAAEGRDDSGPAIVEDVAAELYFVPDSGQGPFRFESPSRGDQGGSGHKTEGSGGTPQFCKNPRYKAAF